jgi:hypothetical protein
MELSTDKAEYIRNHNTCTFAHLPVRYWTGGTALLYIPNSWAAIRAHYGSVYCWRHYCPWQTLLRLIQHNTSDRQTDAPLRCGMWIFKTRQSTVRVSLSQDDQCYPRDLLTRPLSHLFCTATLCCIHLGRTYGALVCFCLLIYRTVKTCP